jgi:hypothetical protein
MTWYVYENWRARGHRMVLHRVNCGHCHYGVGQTGGTHPSKWQMARSIRFESGGRTLCGGWGGLLSLRLMGGESSPRVGTELGTVSFATCSPLGVEFLRNGPASRQARGGDVEQGEYSHQSRQILPMPRMRTIALADAASVPARNRDLSRDSGR